MFSDLLKILCVLNDQKLAPRRDALRDIPQFDYSGRGFLRDDPTVSWHQTLAPENLGSDLWWKSPTLLLPQNSNSKEQAAKADCMDASCRLRVDSLVLAITTLQTSA